MLNALLGTKLGMTQYIHDDGIVSAVTALEVGPCVVTQVKNSEKDGYDKIQIGYKQVPEKKMSNPEKGHLKKNGLDLFKYLREVDSVDSNDQQIGSVVTIAQIFEVGDIVDVIGKSKGKGFAGGVKRWHFAGGPKTHGQGDKHRAPGSVGQGTTPGRVRKGKKMAGHLGAKRSTEKGIKIVAIDEERNLLFVRGSVPGAASGLVMVRKQGRNGK
ncbi:MAG: 50S ribosomal protein L3 [Dehalococcoidia bacterium]